MKRILTTAILLISLNAFSQKPGGRSLITPGNGATPPAFDTAYVFSVADMNQLVAILLESPVVVNGKQLTGKELNQLLTWINSKAKVFPKEQPKK
jgi:hypothetical protein